ncbi:MAG: hypothetical protein IIZ33_00445 [Erysipelotrichaceae bacterium]|nr:hypothetical protein [Erysipelotrichaceae bacterium]
MEKFNEVAAKMREYIAVIQAEADAKAADADEKGQAYVREVEGKTVNAIEMTIGKLSEVVDKVKDEEKVNAFLDKALAKCEEAVAFTREKIAAVEVKPKVDLDSVYGDIRDAFDKIMQNENIQNAANFVKGVGEEVTNFLNKPEIQDRIEKVKDVTISAAEKGLDILKNALTPDEDKHE